MLSKCANPDCNTPFHYLREGRLYQIDIATDNIESGAMILSPMEPKRPHKVEFFWLCGQCAQSMTLTYQRGKGVVAAPMASAISRRVAAS